MKKYNRLELEQDDEMQNEAYGDIKYDEFLQIKPEIAEEIRRQQEEYLKEQHDNEAEETSQAAETRKSRDAKEGSIFKVKKMLRNKQGQDEDEDSESSGFGHYFKSCQRSLKIGKLISSTPCDQEPADKDQS